MSLSAVVTTKNEEANIERCLRSLQFADEVIVVDDFSTDATVARASKLGAQVIQHTWAGYGQQKNIGLDKAQNDWILFLDADEEVPPALAAEIISTLATPKFDIYWLPVLDIFLGKPLRHLTGNNPRLFRKSKARWTTRLVHEQVQQTPGNVVTRLHDDNSGILQNFLLHHGHSSIASYLRKMHRYTTLDAQQMMETRTHRSGRTVAASWHLPFVLSLRQIYKLLVWRKGILDGFSGITWSLLSGYYEWEMAKHFLKLSALRNSEVRSRK